MKRFFLLLLGVALSGTVGAQYVLQTGKVNAHFSASTMVNAVFVGNSDGDQCWVMNTGTPQQIGFGGGNYALVVVDSMLNEKRCTPFQRAKGSSVLGATMNDDTAEILVIDQSKGGRTLYLHHDVGIDKVTGSGGTHHIDTLFTLDYGQHDSCKVWVARSASRQRTAVLSIVQYEHRKQYSATATLYDEHLRPMWSHDVEMGSVESIAVSDDGQILAFANTTKGLSATFFFTLIDSSGSRTTQLQHDKRKIEQVSVAAFNGERALLLGLYLDEPCNDMRQYSDGRVAMLFDAKDMQITETTLLPYTDDDINTLMNQSADGYVADRVLRNVTVMDVVQTQQGAVMRTACVAYSNQNNVAQKTLKGMQLLAVDWQAKLLWQTNIAAYEQCDGNATNMGGLLVENAGKVLLLKNEHRRTPRTFTHKTEAKLTHYDKKTTLVLYEITRQGTVSKQILQRKIRHLPLIAFCKDSRGLSLLFEENEHVVQGRLLLSNSILPVR